MMLSLCFVNIIIKILYYKRRAYKIYKRFWMKGNNLNIKSSIERN